MPAAPASPLPICLDGLCGPFPHHCLTGSLQAHRAGNAPQILPCLFLIESCLRFSEANKEAALYYTRPSPVKPSHRSSLGTKCVGRSGASGQGAAGSLAVLLMAAVHTHGVMGGGCQERTFVFVRSLG